MKRRGQLKLVVDNTPKARVGHEQEVEIKDGVREVLDILNKVKENDLVGLWQECISLPVFSEKQGYFGFVERNMWKFEGLFERIRPAEFQQMHRKVNYLIMLVYLDFMQEMGFPGNDLDISARLRETPELLPWVHYFSIDIQDSEQKAQAKRSGTGIMQVTWDKTARITEIA